MIVESAVRLAAEPFGPLMVAAAITGNPVTNVEPDASRPLMMMSVAVPLLTAAVCRIRLLAVKPRRWSGVPPSVPLFCR